MLINTRKALAVIASICNFCVILFTKNYIEIFHVVYEGICLLFDVSEASTGVRRWEK
jgi:hypothetical protein